LVHHGERLDSPHQARAGYRHPSEWIRALLQRIHFRRPILVGVRQGGFTLLEAILALTLSSVIVGLVSSVFLAQNDFYRLVVQRTRVQDNLRVVTDLIASEIRGVSNGGVITAESRRFVVRLPLAVGGVCHRQGQHGRVYMPGLSEIDGDDVAGYARQDANGDWTYTADTWSNLLESSGADDAKECFNRSGADTLGAAQDFGRLVIPGGTILAEPIMVWQEVEFRIEESELEPATLALFRGSTGSSLREFVSGITPETKFEYATGGSTFFNSVTGAALNNISAIRVTASAIGTDSIGAIGGYQYVWTVKIPLKNSN